MSNEESSLYGENACLSEQELLDYLNGRLDEEKARWVDAHIKGCEFCQDAVEGLAAMKNKEEIPIIVKQIHNQLRHELQSHQSKEKKVKMYAWLSALVFIILLILIIAFMAVQFSLKKQEKIKRTPPSSSNTHQIK